MLLWRWILLGIFVRADIGEDVQSDPVTKIFKVGDAADIRLVEGSMAGLEKDPGAVPNERKEKFSRMKEKMLKDATAALQEINLRAANYGEKAVTETLDGFVWLGTLLQRLFKEYVLRDLLRLIRTRDTLDRVISDDITREKYAEIRAYYVQMVQSKYPNDLIVQAIVLMTGQELLSVLRSGYLQNPRMLYTYLEIARMIPCDSSISLLVDQLDPQFTFSPFLLEQLDGGDYVVLASSLVLPYLDPGHFKRLLMLHPPQDATGLLRDVIWTTVRYPTNNFIRYLAACHEVALLLSDPVVKDNLSQMAEDGDESLFSPNSVALGLLFLAVESTNRTIKSMARRIIAPKMPGLGDENEPLTKEDAVELLRGLDAIVTSGKALVKASTSNNLKKAEQLKTVATWALGLDNPQLDLIVQEELIGLLDLFRVLQIKLAKAARPSDTKLLGIIDDRLSGLAERRQAVNLSLTLFLVRTGMKQADHPSPNYRPWLSYGRLFFWRKATTDATIPTLLKILGLFSGCGLNSMPLCYRDPRVAFHRAYIAIGDLLAPLDGRMTVTEAQIITSALLGALFGLPASVFDCDRSLGRYTSLIGHLNGRLECYCGTKVPTVEFTTPTERDSDIFTARLYRPNAGVKKRAIEPIALDLTSSNKGKAVVARMEALSQDPDIRASMSKNLTTGSTTKPVPTNVAPKALEHSIKHGKPEGSLPSQGQAQSKGQRQKQRPLLVDTMEASRRSVCKTRPKDDNQSQRLRKMGKK